MDEKNLISLTDDIVAAIVDISMGKGKLKAMIPGSVTRKLLKDVKLFNSLKKCYINYLSGVENLIDDRNELKLLFEFRYHLEAIYNGGEIINDKFSLDKATAGELENE